MFEFYVLEHHLVNKTTAETEFSYVGDENQRDAPHCEACGECIGMLTRVPPYVVDLEVWHREFGDLAYGPGLSILVSERLKAVCEEHGVVGFEAFDPVEVVHVKKHKRFKGDPPPYYHVTVVRGEAAIDQEKSGFEWEQPPTCPVCKEGDVKRWQRIVLEPNTWSGEDVFMPRGLGGTYMATARFKEICEQYRIRNAYFIPAEEYEHDFYPWDNTRRAEELARCPLSEGILERIKPNGDRLRYCVRTNELVTITPDGSVHMFRPLEGIKYWNQQ